MTSRERLIETINHRQPDKIVVDMGGSPQTGIACSTLSKLREFYGLDKKPVKVQECMQMLGVVEEDIRNIVGGDCIGLWRPMNNFGIENKDFKPWQMPDGTNVLMAGGFEYDKNEKGEILVYPQGNRNYSPSAMMPATGDFFDGIDRVGEMDEDDLDALSHWKDQYAVYSDYVARRIEEDSIDLYNNTQLGIVGIFGGMGIGDAASLPGVGLLSPKGIRRYEDFMMAHYLYPEYIHELFSYQAEVAIKNLEIYKQAVGDRIQVAVMGGTDFGSQNGELISPDMYREFYKPYFKKVNDWVHQNTSWKTFYHSCGSIVNLLDDMIESGTDILNPVQCSAAGMDPKMLKEKYGDKLVFWGGGIDTQKTLPFGSKEEVEAEVAKRCEIFAPGGGFVFSSIHNIVAKAPAENVAKMFETVKKINEGK
ncbi:MAG: uroporphyrinogen decarboxylase family protein [Bacillota bacterium]